MKKLLFQTQSIEDRTRQNWIQELVSYGVTSGPEGQALNSMGYVDLRTLLAKEQIVREE